MKEQENAAIGLRLKKARRLRGLTQEELSLAINCNPSHICNVESGRCSLSLHSFIAVCRILDVSMDYILLGSHGGGNDALVSQIIAETSDASGKELLEYLQYIRYRKYLSASEGSMHRENETPDQTALP